MWPNPFHPFSKVENESQRLEMICPDLTQQNYEYFPVSDSVFSWRHLSLDTFYSARFCRTVCFCFFSVVTQNKLLFQFHIFL